MALCRCERHGQPQGRTVEYVAYVLPLGYPNTALICGRCDAPGLIWLDKREVLAYEDGQRIFKGPSNFTKMKADDSEIRTLLNFPTDI